MKIFALVLILGMQFLTLTLLAQDEYHSEEWNSWNIMGARFTEPVDCIRLSDTSFIVLARTNADWPFGSKTTPLIACYTINGELLWQTHYGLGRQLFLNPVGILPAREGWKVVGMGYPDKYQNPSGKSVAMLVDINELGYFVRSREFPSGEIPYFSSVIALNDYTYAVTTGTNGIPRVNFYSPDDRIRWYDSLEQEDPTILYGLNGTSDGVILAGRSVPVDTSKKAYTVLARWSASGHLQWLRTYKPSIDEYVVGAASLSDGTFLTYGFRRESRSNFLATLVVMRVSNSGDSLMLINDPGYTSPVPSQLIQRSGGEILMSWSDIDSSHLGHVKFGGIPRIAKIASPGITSPVKMTDISDDIMVVLDRRAIMNDEQTSLAEMYTRVVVLKRQNASSVHDVLECLMPSMMNLK